MSPYQRTFYFQLAFVTANFGPDVFEFLIAIPVVEWAEGHGWRLTPRFINIAIQSNGFALRKPPLFKPNQRFLADQVAWLFESE